MKQILSDSEFGNQLEVNQGLELQWVEGIPQLSAIPIDSIRELIVLLIIIGINLVIVGVIAYYVLRLQGRKKESASKKHVSKTSPEQLLIEMEEFAQTGDFQLAIKKCFHYLLKMLSEKRNITFAKTKTNGEYRQDFMQVNRDEADTFHKLSVYFDEVWYGEKKIGKQDYLQYRRAVFQFVGEVDLHEKR